MIDMAANALSQEGVWFDKWRCDDAEAAYQLSLVGGGTNTCNTQVNLV